MEHCPTCERPVEGDQELLETIASNLVEDDEEVIEDEMSEEPVEEGEPEDLSDLEELEALIENLESQPGFNLWRADRIAKLKKFADGDNFDEEGNRLDEKVPEREVVLHQLSPPEAVALDGWWEAPVGEFGKLFRQDAKRLKAAGFRNETAFKKATLGISRSRSNGAFVIRNQRETANYFLSNTEDAARKTGTTTRIIAMMGHQLDQWSYMLPSFDFYGASEKKAKARGVGHFALDPEVPFTDEEKEHFKWMGILDLNKNFGLAMLGGSVPVPLITNPKEVIKGGYTNGKRTVAGIHVAAPNKHRIMWTVNNPWLMIPRLILTFNSSSFKHSLWRTMCYKANRIDYGYAAPIPGWVPREDIDNDLSDNIRTPRHNPQSAWDERHGENTAAWSKTKPLFVAGSELERDGTPKEYGRD